MNARTVRPTMIQWVCPICETIYYQYPKDKELEFYRSMKKIERTAKYFFEKKHQCVGRQS